MGRGRAKAKQTKVARELKYNSGNTDFSALQAELASAAPLDDDDDLGAVDPYAKYFDDEDSDDESDGDSGDSSD